jgi:hypothetical protein
MNRHSEQLTFWELINKYENGIEIPIIQRDYAQGRDSENTIRDKFVKTLYSAFRGEPVVLDYVYGYTENEKLIPLDGQQRLTTLFLLHWYLLCKDEDSKIKLRDATPILRRFSYKVRDNSRDFCSKLAEYCFSGYIESSLKAHIENQHWFFLHWKNDPTVASMLNMIDAIEKEFVSYNGYFDKLVGENIISFVFLDLKEEFKQGDLLYVRMNARGKRLTDFELFKSVLQPLSKGFGLTGFSDKIDTSWTEYFWGYKNESNEIDDTYLSALKATINNSYFSKITRDEITANKYRTDSFKADEQSEEFTKRLTCDVLADVELHFDNLCKNSVNLHNNGFARVFANKSGMEYREMLMWYATCISGNENWLRVIRQLTDNSEYDRFSDYHLALVAINKWSVQCEGMSEYIREAGEEFVIEGKGAFAELMMRELLLKTKLMSFPQWNELIRRIEKEFVYFRGQIGFLFTLSGIGLSTDINQACIATFENVCDKARKIWGNNGLSDSAKHNETFRRALLAIGDYLGSYNSNHTFYTDVRHRDLGWHNYLSKVYEERDTVLIKLFNELDTEAIFDDMQKIIDGYLIANKSEWQKWFVKFPQMFEIMNPSKNMIRRWNDDYIYILRGERMSGQNYEYHSYALFLELIGEGVQGLEYPALSGDGYKYLHSKGKSNLRITYSRDKDNGYSWKVWRDNGEDVHKIYKAREDAKNYLIENAEQNKS